MEALSQERERRLEWKVSKFYNSMQVDLTIL